METVLSRLSPKELKPEPYKRAWEKVQLARKSDRPQSMDYMNNIFNNFFELHGDRNFADDLSIVGGIGWLKDIPVTVIGQQKGSDLKDKAKRNFGMTNPDGYKKALRLIRQAEKFNRAVVCFVDTPGAYCGVEAEKRGQAYAIANNLLELFGIKIPIISIVIGEGGSGGALAISVCDRFYMMENSVYSVISPEGCASILWKDASRAQEAAETLGMTAQDLKKAGFIDGIIEEPEDYDRENMMRTCNQLKEMLYADITALSKLGKDVLVENRQNKFLGMNSR